MRFKSQWINVVQNHFHYLTKDQNLTGTATQSQGGPGSNGNKEVASL